jgi:hypothetical protein
MQQNKPALQNAVLSADYQFLYLKGVIAADTIPKALLYFSFHLSFSSVLQNQKPG